ncbi:hypothetical protein, partial [Klebsiella pneumoniae]|uniref:hypothetical protein n=1 Tax=Klebsiella pneumoniae TaxID=573 RepID=UPI001CD24C60
MIGLIDAIQGVQQQLSELSSTHRAGGTDDKELTQLIGYLKQWEDGSNVGTGQTGEGGHPVVAVSAPAGMVLASQDNVVVGAQTHIDMVSIGNT